MAARLALAYDGCGDDDDGKPHEECGVFGIWSSQANAARVAFFALFALNHRGQEMAGIASLDATGVHVHKGAGLVSQVFEEADMAALRGGVAIGHTRYSTSGGSHLSGAQPFVLETDLGPLALAHNGQVAQHSRLRKMVLGRGTGLFSSSDSEIIAQLLARPHDPAEAAAYAASAAAAAAAAASEESGGETSPSAGGAGVARAAAALAAAAAVPPSPSRPPRGAGATAVDAVGRGSGGAGSGGSGSAASAPAVRAAAATTAAASNWPAWVARIAAFMDACDGAYSLVLLTRDAVFAVRDPLGMRPLCLGVHAEEDGSSSYLVASESCAFGTVGATMVREVAPGEIVRIDASGFHSIMPRRAAPFLRAPAFCIFEYIYFARPDSILEGQMVHSVRTRLGAALAAEAPAPGADLVSGVPDSSIAAAIGYATAAGLPFSEVFCKNRYIERTFIKPDDALRKNAIQLKYNPLTHVLRGKRVVLVDDSLVRGNTLAQLVPLLRHGGAAEVHIRISSPPIKYSCHMGVDIGSKEELIAAMRPDVEAIRAYIGADSLVYLSLEGMVASVAAGYDARDALGDPLPRGHCTACFTGGALGCLGGAGGHTQRHITFISRPHTHTCRVPAGGGRPACQGLLLEKIHGREVTRQIAQCRFKRTVGMQVTWYIGRL